MIPHELRNAMNSYCRKETHVPTKDRIMLSPIFETNVREHLAREVPSCKRGSFLSHLYCEVAWPDPFVDALYVTLYTRPRELLSG